MTESKQLYEIGDAICFRTPPKTPYYYDNELKRSEDGLMYTEEMIGIAKLPGPFKILDCFYDTTFHTYVYYLGLKPYTEYSCHWLEGWLQQPAWQKADITDTRMSQLLGIS